MYVSPGFKRTLGELKSVGDLSNWDVSNVTNMNGMFYECNELEFIGDISKWNVSNVTNMTHMFNGCNNFNQDISEWDVSNVTNMRTMFGGCNKFNQDMKTLNQYIKEKLVINKDYHDNMIVIKSFDELRKIIKDRYDKLGPGTEQDPVDFNDIDVSNLDSFCSNNTGIFEGTKFSYIRYIPF